MTGCNYAISSILGRHKSLIFGAWNLTIWATFGVKYFSHAIAQYVSATIIILGTYYQFYNVPMKVPQKLMYLILTFHMQVQMPSIFKKDLESCKKYQTFTSKDSFLLCKGTVWENWNLSIWMGFYIIKTKFDIIFHQT